MKIVKPEKTLKTRYGHLYAIRIEIPEEVVPNINNIRMIRVPKFGDKNYIEIFFENIHKNE